MKKPKIRFKGYQEDWEQRKLGDVFEQTANFVNPNDDDIELWSLTVEDGLTPKSERYNREFLVKKKTNFKEVRPGDIVYNPMNMTLGAVGFNGMAKSVAVSGYYTTMVANKGYDSYYINTWLKSPQAISLYKTFATGSLKEKQRVQFPTLSIIPATFPEHDEQTKIGSYFEHLDHLITLHHRKQNYVLNTLIYAKTTLFITKEKKKMPELEKVIEDKLIEQLVFGESQWTYREDLKTEEDLWQNFRYILEQNNKARLDGQPLSDAEFEQVKNQLQFSSFYKAGEWLVGENGKAMVHVQRDTEKLHLVVMNHEHIAGGSSVYEVINQYNALKDDDITTVARDRRFDVTLMINGLPMIHIELKNRQHSYMDAFYQIKKYISEGKFTGIFSAVQMFVISNGVDTKYFAAASDTELNPKFMSGWVDTENNPVADYIDFAKNVLRIPEAHEMIARYTVLDEDAKRLILLRPYQIHAIESMLMYGREAQSKTRIASPATIPKSGERNRKIHSCMLYLISI